MVEGKPPIYIGDELPVLPLGLASDANLAKMATACRRYLHECYDLPYSANIGEEEVEPISFGICDLGEADYLDAAQRHAEEYLPCSQISLIIGPRSVGIEAVAVTEKGRFEEEQLKSLLRQRLPRRFAISSVERLTEVTTEDIWQIACQISPRSDTVGSAYRIMDDATRLVSLGGAEPDAPTAYQWVRSGRPDLLLGFHESGWLEAKSAPYQMDEAGKIELAQDVARFANSKGGLLVIGVKAKKTKDGDEVFDRLSPIPSGMIKRRQYLDVINRRVVPVVEDLSFHYAETVPGKGVAAILVPNQNPDAQPFLVHGAIAGGKVEGSFFSIVRRRGDDSVTVEAREIHGWLAQGRRRAMFGDLKSPADPSSPVLANTIRSDAGPYLAHGPSSGFPSFGDLPSATLATPGISRLAPGSWLVPLGPDVPDLTMRVAAAIPGSLPLMHYSGKIAARLRGEAREDVILETLNALPLTKWLTAQQTVWHWEGDPQWEVVGSGSAEFTQAVFRPTWANERVPPLIARCGVNTGFASADAEGMESSGALQMALDIMLQCVGLDKEQQPLSEDQESAADLLLVPFDLHDIAQILLRLLNAIPLTATLAGRLLESADVSSGEVGAWIGGGNVELSKLIDFSEFRRITGSYESPTHPQVGIWPLSLNPNRSGNAESQFLAELFEGMLERNGYRGVGPFIQTIEQIEMN